MAQSVIRGATAPTGFKRGMIHYAPLMAATAPSACIVDLDLDTDSDGDRRRITGSGHVVTETRTVSPYSRVRASGIGRLILQPSDSEFVEVRADDNVLPLLGTVVRDGTLFLGPDSDITFREITEIVYTVGYRQLNRIAISGVMEGEALAIDTDFLSVGVSGVSSFRTAGWAFDHDAQVSGVSTYLAGDLETSLTMISASGVSSAVVWVSEELDATASGVSRIRYKGNPVVHASVSGAGRVTRY